MLHGCLKTKSFYCLSYLVMCHDHDVVLKKCSISDLTCLMFDLPIDGKKIEHMVFIILQVDNYQEAFQRKFYMTVLLCSMICQILQ